MTDTAIPVLRRLGQRLVDFATAPLENREHVVDERALILAERLGLTRQQIINLRKSARARLSRRISKWE